MKMGDWKLVLPFVAALIIIGLAGFSFAAITVTKTNLATSALSFREDTAFALYNITVNSTDETAPSNISDVNITLPVSFSYVGINGTDAGGTNLFRNSTTSTSIILQWHNATGTAVASGLINGSALGNVAGGGIKNFWFNASASTPGIYNVTIEVKNATRNYNTNITVRINDTTVPVVMAQNITMVAHNNLSGTAILNVSVYDNSIVNAVFFNITNSSGQVAILNATNSAGSDWNVSFLTTGLADGVYNVTVFANDTYGDQNFTTFVAGNLNNTAQIRIVVDNTAPSATPSCSPNPVTSGETITCTCTGTDVMTGINSTSGDSTPSTTGTGLYTFGCTVTDYAGNTGTASYQYRVDGASGGGSSSSSGLGGSSTSITWARTVDKGSSDVESSAVTQELGSRERARIVVHSVEHHVGIVSLSATSAIIEISSTPQRATFALGESKDFDITEDGKNDVSVTLVSIQNNKATVSVVAIKQPATTTTTTTTSGSQTGASAPSSGSSSLWWIIGIVVLVIVVVVIFFVVRKRQ